MTLTRYAPLRSGPWRRKAVAASAPDWKQRDAEERRRHDRERQIELKALVYGCEYGQLFLREWFRRNGCPTCPDQRWSPRCELHHAKSRKSGGRAEHQVPLCKACHGEGHVQGWRQLEERSGVNLDDLAAILAAEGRRQGYLPVERCPECGTWHSARFFVDVVDVETGELVARLCQGCAPEGPR